VRHVFRLLERAARDRRPVPWVLLENVEALLDRRSDGPPVVAWLAAKFEALGYRSWAHRVVCSSGFGVPNRRKRVFMLASMHGDARDVLLAQVSDCVCVWGGEIFLCNLLIYWRKFGRCAKHKPSKNIDTNPPPPNTPPNNTKGRHALPGRLPGRRGRRLLGVL
jgi:site-specific DNA-cytosine methylase